MRYMLIHATSAEIHDDDPEDAAALTAWIEEMVARGVVVDGHRLRPPADARSVRMHAGEVVVVDGPFAESKEEIAGFDILECADLDEAVEIASKHPTLRHGTIEVRPYLYP